MAEFEVGRSNAGAGTEQKPALGEDRVLIVRDQILQWKLDGKVFFVQQGDAGTKLDFVEAAYDEDQPQFALLVPKGIVCIPLSLHVTFETVDNTGTHCIWSTTTNSIGNGTSTALSPVNYRRDEKYAPACKANSLYTANATAATGLIEIKRFYSAYAQAAVTDADSVVYHPFDYTDPAMPVLVGPATLQMHCYSGTSGPHGYGEYTWVEEDAAIFGL